ncbi:hypothetical protein Pfo_013287 [Paulownia fortunei]|nr:hypothetical protein Pfo_013287 [Paulownia fortunei]
MAEQVFDRFATMTSRRKYMVSIWDSLVIETAEGETSSESPPESFARRLILLRHAKAPWENRSLRAMHKEQGKR